MTDKRTKIIQAEIGDDLTKQIKPTLLFYKT